MPKTDEDYLKEDIKESIRYTTELELMAIEILGLNHDIIPLIQEARASLLQAADTYKSNE